MNHDGLAKRPWSTCILPTTLFESTPGCRQDASDPAFCETFNHASSRLSCFALDLVRHVFILLAVTASFFFALAAPPPLDGVKDVFFLIDVTGSMIGLPKSAGNQDILGPILNRVEEHVDFDCREGDTLHVATFQEKLHDLDAAGTDFGALRSFPMRSGLDEARKYILSIEAGVQKEFSQRSGVGYTGIYGSVHEILQVMKRRAEEKKDVPNYSQRLVLFTDGEENVSNYKREDILKEFGLLREETGMGDRVFFKVLFYGQGEGKKEAPFEDDPQNGLSVGEADPKAPVRVPIKVGVPSDDLGDLQGETSAGLEFTLEPQPPALTELRVSLPPAIPGAPAGLAVTSPVKLANGRGKLQFDWTSPAPAGVPFSLKVKLEAPDPRFEISPDVVAVKGVFGIKPVQGPVAPPLPVVPPRHPLSPLVWILAGLGLLVVGMLLFCSWNRPSARLWLDSPGLVRRPLRQVQGFFSHWVLVGSSRTAALNHNGLPEKAFFIKATKLGGIRFRPLMAGFSVLDQACPPKKEASLMDSSEIVFKPEGAMHPVVSRISRD